MRVLAFIFPLTHKGEAAGYDLELTLQYPSGAYAVVKTVQWEHDQLDQAIAWANEKWDLDPELRLHEPQRL